jgi:hypothetical protein
LLKQNQESLICSCAARENHTDAEAEADLKKIAISPSAGLVDTTSTDVTAVNCTLSGDHVVWRWSPGPFNFPYLRRRIGLVVVPAAIAGCTVIAKPSERCPAFSTVSANCSPAGY